MLRVSTVCIWPSSSAEVWFSRSADEHLWSLDYFYANLLLDVFTSLHCCLCKGTFFKNIYIQMKVQSLCRVETKSLPVWALNIYNKYFRSWVNKLASVWGCKVQMVNLGTETKCRRIMPLTYPWIVFQLIWLDKKCWKAAEQRGEGVRVEVVDGTKGAWWPSFLWSWRQPARHHVQLRQGRSCNPFLCSGLQYTHSLFFIFSFVSYLYFNHQTFKIFFSLVFFFVCFGWISYSVKAAVPLSSRNPTMAAETLP